MKQLSRLTLLLSGLAFPLLGLADEAPTLDTGNTAWMLTSTALVLLMTIPGLALFYAGMVRKKNVLATMMQSFAITGLVSVLWMIVGYSLAFDTTGMEEGVTNFASFVGGLDKLFLAGVGIDSLTGTIPETVFMTFQMTFAIITPALITGAFAERMKFSAMLWFMGLWLLVVYAPIAHMVWSGPGGLFWDMGVLDFAGGTVVHINAGIAGLIAAIMLGKRVGYGKEILHPHNLTLTVIGAAMLWVGWMFVEWLGKGKPSVLGIASGAVAGLVAITPASGFVAPVGALVIGIAAGVICYWGATSLKKMLGYDDSLDVFGVHGIGGIIGALLTGFFAVEGIGGVAGSFSQFITQVIGVAITIVYTGVLSFIILKVIDLTIGLRVTEEEERMGLDIALHGERVD